MAAGAAEAMCNARDTVQGMESARLVPLCTKNIDKHYTRLCIFA